MSAPSVNQGLRRLILKGREVIESTRQAVVTAEVELERASALLLLSEERYLEASGWTKCGHAWATPGDQDVAMCLREAAVDLQMAADEAAGGTS